ncbi:hypothetical protein FUT79_12030 [Treponema phagedenis]|uniref:Uncharacterized protein n=1 Tax=Treponema phagedenis TaxID=162 RepID=A0AAE6IV97_TREPH|nr:hypothetical protein FUT79_12030 [Treponema phagedenis]QEJ98858.1 hypothetical protein FUT82_13210 [Treponema phagedenis]
MVPNRSDVLKQSSLQSFKTRRCNFAMDGKITPTRRRSERKTGKASPLRRVGLFFITGSFKTRRRNEGRIPRFRPCAFISDKHLYRSSVGHTD